MDTKPDIKIATNQAEIASIMPPGAMQEIDPTFNEVLNQIEQDKAKKAEEQAKLDQLTAKTAPKTAPIELKYQYTGVDPNGHEVVTLEMDIANKHYVTAFCLVEKKQIESREVVNLESKESMSDMSEEKRILSKSIKK